MKGNKQQPRLLLITGIMAAGKSTMAQHVAESMPRSVHLHGDAFRRMIINGRAEMGLELSSEAQAQLQPRYALSASVAANYLDAGFSVVYQDIILGDDLRQAVLRLQRYIPHVVVLCPRPDVVTAREAGRAKTGYGELSVTDFDAMMHRVTPRIDLWLDTSEQSAVQSTALFLHGGMSNIEEFNAILPDLEGKFRIIGIDSRGQGKSTLGTGELAYAQLQKDVECVLQHLGVNAVSIIGFSDGGITAMRMAASSWRNIEKLIVIGTDWHSKNLEAMREIFSRVTGESWRNKFPHAYDAYQKLNPEPNFDVQVERVVKMWLDESSASYPNQTVQNINCPLLIVRGDDDHLLARQTAVQPDKPLSNWRNWLKIHTCSTFHSRGIWLLKIKRKSS
jgi:pimeloyl-ACP methyl ester carboxylesterase